MRFLHADSKDSNETGNAQADMSCSLGTQIIRLFSSCYGSKGINMLLLR